MGKKPNTTDIYARLITTYHPERPLNEYKSLSTSEKGICYHATLIPCRKAVVFQVDGCIIHDGNKCDKLILSVDPSMVNTWIGHFIELKGTDVNHAILQLESTINNPIFQDRTLSRRYARIVARCFPSQTANPDIERARIRFRKKYKCELKTIKSLQPDNI